MTAPEGGGPPGTGENGAAQASPGGGSRLLLKRLAGVMAEAGDGQQRIALMESAVCQRRSFHDTRRRQAQIFSDLTY